MAGKLVEYLCFACGAQGTQLMDAPSVLLQGGDNPFRKPDPKCPLCGRKVACFEETEAATDLRLAVV